MSAPSQPTSMPRTLLRAYLFALVFLAPLKFGTLVDSAGISLFPRSGWDVFLGLWPPFLLPALCGGALLWALAVHPLPPLRARANLVPGVWLALIAGSLPGLIRTTEINYTLLFLAHLLGAFCLGAAALLTLRADPPARSVLLAALILGASICAADGWSQVAGGGLRRTAAVIEAQARRSGQPLSADLLSRLHQNRAFATFVYPNSFAAHLLLTAPLVLLGLWRFGGKFQPPRLSRIVLAGAGLVLTAGALWMSGSRAAFVALAGGLATGAFFQPRLARFRVPIIAAAVLVGLSAVAVLTLHRSGQKLGALYARVGYYRAAVRMFRRHPLTGVGLGEFFPWYTRWKGRNVEETRQPHNMFLSFLSQAGILGGAAAFMWLCLPLFLPWLAAGNGPRSDPPLITAVQVGLAAWSLHTLSDFDIQVPATVALAALLPALCLPGAEGPRRPPPAAPGGKRRAGIAAPALLALLALANLRRWPGERAYAALDAATQSPNIPMTRLEPLARRAARLLPWSPYPWSKLGHVAEKRRDFHTAARAFANAARRAPHRAAFHRHAAFDYARIGNLEQARNYARSALEWEPNNPRADALRALLDAPAALPRGPAGAPGT